nr:2OG-Fe(II) oxygenase [uncultured Albidiferax sp.]
MTTNVPMRFPDCSLLTCIERIVPAMLCRTVIGEIETGHPLSSSPSSGFRDQDRVIRDDPQLAASLFELLKPHLPTSIGSLRLVGLNDRLRLYRYRPGQRFTPHMDHWYQSSPTRISLLTALVYLNEDFKGGETRFMEQVESVITPTTGSAVFFQHKVRHEGCEVLEGTKYALRTDVMYEADSEIVLLLQ